MSSGRSRDASSLWRRRERSRRRTAYLVYAVAVMGLLSAASRPLHGRFELLLEVVPFVVPRAAAVTLVFVSFALLPLARGLRHGLRLAWVWTLLLLMVSLALHVINGLDVEEAVMCAAAAGWLVAKRAAFPVRPSRASAKRALVLGGSGAAVVVVLSTALAQAVGRHNHPPSRKSAAAVAERLGGQGALSLPGIGHYVTPVLVAIGVCLVTGTLWLLFSPRRSPHLAPEEHHQERERARDVVQRYGGDTLAYFALRDDKEWFFTGRSVVAHSVRGSVALVSPDPIGPPEERPEVWTEFMAYTERSGWSVAVLGAGQDWLPVYEASGMRAVYLGDEAVVDCPSFSLEGRAMKTLRSACRRVQRAGYTVTFHDPSRLEPELRAALLAMAGRSRRGEDERGFSMTLSRLLDPKDTGLLLAVATDAVGAVGGFVQWVPARDIGGWSLDVMRRDTGPSVPNGVMDFLIVRTIEHVAASGGQGLGLNFAVMRSVVAGERDGTLAGAGQRLLRRLSRRAQIESLWRFSDKYAPRWAPRYAVVGTVEAVAGQVLAMAGAEGVTELPVVGRFAIWSGR